MKADYKKFQEKDVPVSKIVHCLSGNSGLTEEYLYNQIQDKGERKYRILTGSTDYQTSQYTHRCKHPKDSNKLIQVIEGKPVIHVVRKGKAGSVKHFEKGNYTINDDAYLLYLKDGLDYQVDLKWLMYELKPRFLEYSSSSDNGTWNKTGFFKEVKVDIPSIEEQLELTEKYDQLELLKAQVENILAKIDHLFTRQIVSMP